MVFDCWPNNQQLTQPFPMLLYGYVVTQYSLSSISNIFRHFIMKFFLFMLWTCHCNNETDSKIKFEWRWVPLKTIRIGFIIFFFAVLFVWFFFALQWYWHSGMLCNEYKNYQNARSNWIYSVYITSFIHEFAILCVFV